MRESDRGLSITGILGAIFRIRMRREFVLKI